MATMAARGDVDQDEAADGAILLDHREFDPRVHDGMVTLTNPRSGGHRTFRIRTQADDASFAPGERVVSLLRGPDRDSYRDWTSFGFVKQDGRIAVWGSHRGTQMETYARMLADPARWAARGVTYLVEARCRRCQRPLTHPESIASGLGPICEGR